MTRVTSCVFLLLQAPSQRGAGHVLVHGRRLKLLPCRPCWCCCLLRLQDPSGGRVRLRLQPLLQDVAASLLQPDSPALFSLSSPLGLTGGVPLLPVSNAAFTRTWCCSAG